VSVLAELPKLYLYPTRRLTETKPPLGNTPVVTSDLKLKETESQGSLGPEISKNLSGASMEEDFEKDLELNRSRQVRRPASSSCPWHWDTFSKMATLEPL
jgi:hypothetical protein